MRYIIYQRYFHITGQINILYTENGTKTHPRLQLARYVDQFYGAILTSSACRVTVIVPPVSLYRYLPYAFKNIFWAQSTVVSYLHREKAVESCHHEYLQKLASTGIQYCSYRWPFTLPADILKDAYFSMQTKGMSCLLIP